jgi:hypothetical protein
MHIKLTVNTGTLVIVTPCFGGGQLRLESAKIEVTIKHKIPGAALGGFDFLGHVGNTTAAGQRRAALLGRKLS